MAATNITIHCSAAGCRAEAFIQLGFEFGTVFVVDPQALPDGWHVAGGQFVCGRTHEPRTGPTFADLR